MVESLHHHLALRDSRANGTAKASWSVGRVGVMLSAEQGQLGTDHPGSGTNALLAI